MQNFSQILLEARNQNKNVSSVLTPDMIDKYVTTVKKQLPHNIQDVIYLTKKYNLLDGNTLREILDSSKSTLHKYVSEFVTLDELIDLQKQLLALKQNIRLLPQFQTSEEREEFYAGKIHADDLTVDLSTTAGRNAAAKQYMPLVNKIANDFVGKCSFDRAELISIGMHGLAEAINDYDPEKMPDKTFKTYAAYRIWQGITTDISKYSHDLSGTSWYANKKYGDQLDAVSIDSLMSTDDEGNYSNDHIAALGVSDDLRWIDLPKSEQEYWETLFKLLESKFSVKECNIFYRYFGLGEFWGKKEKSKDIAKSYGMSEGNIRNSIINKMLRFIKSDSKTRNILQSIQTIYNESLMRDLIYFTEKQAIYEALISDDMFILLEELNRWRNKDVLKNTVNNALECLTRDENTYIKKCLKEGFMFIDDTYKKNKQTITKFLSYIYPTEVFTKLSDVTIIEYITELSDTFKEFKIKW